MRVEVINEGLNSLNNDKHIINNKRKVVGYARVSTEKDEQFSSYEAQIEYYTNLIKSHDDWIFTGIYTDEGISGTSTKNRLGFQKMIKDALKGKFDLIITKSISRFARNTLDSLMAIRKLKEAGVEIYFEKENIWTLDSKGELLITIMSSIAQEESRSISMNVTWGIRQSMKQGKAYVPYKVFLGYDKGPNGEMIINEEQAKVVRMIYGYAMQKRSAYQIAKIMEEKHIPFSPGVYKWHTSTVRSILTNEKYKGDALRQKTYTADYLSKEKIRNKGDVPQYYIHNHHPAIISEDIFDRLQESLKTNKDNNYRRSKNYLFSKRIVCPYCGNYYGPSTWLSSSGTPLTIWRCNSKYKKETQRSCISPSLKEEYITQFLIKEINRLIERPNVIINQLSRIIRSAVLESNAIINRLNWLKNKKTLINSFDDDMWYTLLSYLVAHNKNEILMTWNKL